MSHDMYVTSLAQHTDFANNCAILRYYVVQPGSRSTPALQKLPGLWSRSEGAPEHVEVDDNLRHDVPHGRDTIHEVRLSGMHSIPSGLVDFTLR